MKRALFLAVCCLIIFAAATPARAQEMKGFRADLIGQIEYGQKEIVDLENAIPVAKMTWRPAKGVRSIAEVYAHIGFGNYLFAKFAGATLPEGVVISAPDDEQKWEKKYTEKAAINDQLVKSFEFLKTAIKNMSDDTMDDMVDFFGMKMTRRAVLMAGMGHQREHLGQSIAYARSVGVVPPWTAAQMAAAKDKK
jgi:uncharacterized damage-inducible protein DinB